MASRSEALQKSDRDNQLSNRGAKAATTKLLDVDRLSWGDLNIFLAITEAGSFRAAAGPSRRAINTVRVAVDRLERIAGGELFRRSVAGVKLTSAGEAIRDIAIQMRVAARSASREANMRAGNAENTVRIAVTEGLGTFWLIPRLVDFQAANREVTVDVTCDMRPGDILLRETDIAVTLDRPDQADAVVGKLGNLHLMLFASQGYVNEYGGLDDIEQWHGHRFVEQVAPNVPHQMLDLFVSAERPAGSIAMRANTSSAHYWAVAQGAGIGLLPTYIRAISRKVQPLGAPFRLRRDIWFSIHADARRSPEVSQALDWLKASFDPVKYPWFREQFMHPAEFSARIDDAKIVQLFEGFIDRD